MDSKEDKVLSQGPWSIKGKNAKQNRAIYSQDVPTLDQYDKNLEKTKRSKERGMSLQNDGKVPHFNGPTNYLQESNQLPQGYGRQMGFDEQQPELSSFISIEPDDMGNSDREDMGGNIESKSRDKKVSFIDSQSNPHSNIASRFHTPSIIASPPDLEAAREVKQDHNHGYISNRDLQASQELPIQLSLEQQSSDQIERQPLNQSRSQKLDYKLENLKVPQEGYRDIKNLNGQKDLVSDVPTSKYTEGKQAKNENFLDTQSSLSEGSNDQRGVFYPNPIDDLEDASHPKKLYRSNFVINLDGLFLFLLYICAFCFYLVIRIKFSLKLGNYVAYGWIMVIVEALGGLSVLNFGFLGIFRAVGNKIKWDPGDQLMETDRRYNIRVLIPCYKENLEIVSHTVMACYYAPVPSNCFKTIYVLDDGNDPQKEKWVQGINSDNVVYLNNRKKHYVPAKDKKGHPLKKSDGSPLMQYAEVNGKAENINNALSNYIYKDLKPEDIPLNEMICIMDADQVACRAFFMRMVPLLDTGDNLGMVISPQCFYNTPPYSDIFNHSNIHFWEYILPGADALQVIFCPGSNVLIRSQALCQAEWFPTNSVTEDFVLGMKFAANGWRFRYVKEYLAVGEAPDTLVQCLQQKSRWCKGHFQIIFNYRDSPFTIKGLSLMQRFVYIVALYNYIANVLNMIFFFCVPVIAIWFGIFPLIINYYVALAMSIYYFSLLLLKYYTRMPSIWLQVAFANIANFTLSFTYLKAVANGLWSSLTGRLKTFKVTEKKDTSKKASSHHRAQFFQTLRLIWPFWILFYVQLFSLLFAIIWLTILYHTETTTSLNISLAGAPTEIALSIVWICYNFLPYYLVIHYTYFGTGVYLNAACFITIAVQILAYAMVILVVWLLLAVEYPYGGLLDDSIYFLETQKSGFISNSTIPNRVPWRHDATIYDGQDIKVDLTGGLFSAGLYGNLKATLPIAYVSSMLAWSLISFKESYLKASSFDLGVNQLKWQLEYLSKTVIVGQNGRPYAVVMQVGKGSSENSYWGRPEDLDQSRPVYSYIGMEGGADAAAQLAAAFASAYKVFKNTQPGYANIQAQQAIAIYQYMQKIQDAPLYKTSDTNTVNIVYTQKNTQDDFMWAAAWMFEAFEDPQYMRDFFYYRTKYLNTELDRGAYYFAWDFVYWGAETLISLNPSSQGYGDINQVQRDLDYMWNKQVCQQYNQYILSGFLRINDTASNQSPQWPRKLGTLANHAFLALLQSKHVRSNSQAVTYYCWAETTIRAFLGENTLKRNFVGGYQSKGKVNHKRQQERASSCGLAPELCNRLHNYFNTGPNPHTLNGSLAFQLGFYDDRSNPANLVSIENNIGYTASLAGLINNKFEWNQCWRIQSLRFRKNPICHNYGWAVLKTGYNG